jgi:amidohydrolase
VGLSGLGRAVLAAGLLVTAVEPALAADRGPDPADVARRIDGIESQVIAWRRDLHQNPELGNREFRTSKLVAEHLRRLGLEVRTDVAYTGVVGVLKGGLPGRVVALRADMDALPVVEQVDLPFASKVRSTYNGLDVGVMHACGHDVHTSVLMGAASVLAGVRERIPGTIVFLFQPAEEGAPAGEEGGARLMIEQGALDNPKAEAIFGLHTWPGPPGALMYRAGGTMAGSDTLRIVVKGRQTHAAVPWRGIDPIVVASQIVLGLQTIASRQVDSATPVVISIGRISGGVRYNIIPDEVEMAGTIRVIEPKIHEDVRERVRRTARSIAEASGATAEVEITPNAIVTYNDPELTRRMVPTLQRAAGSAGAFEAPPLMPAEDFSYYQERIPGVFFFLGINKEGVPAEAAAPNHSPLFYVNEAAMRNGVRAMVGMALDYLTGK